MFVCGSADMKSPALTTYGAAPRVLLVEDNTLIAMDLETILQESGCEVVGPFATVCEATFKIRSEPVHVAVVDFVLEDGTADPIAKMLDDRGIPYALCTGVEELTLSTRYPHTPILGKLYNPDDVRLVINSLIASRLTKA